MVIGVFTTDLGRDALERVDIATIAHAAEKRGRQIFVFDQSGIDFNTFTVLGMLRVDGVWQQQRVPLPATVVGLRIDDSSGSYELDWLNEHTVMVVAELPEAQLSLCRRILQSSSLREQICTEGEPVICNESNAAELQVLWCRIRVNRGLEAHSPSASIERLEVSDQAAHTAFSDSQLFIEAHLKYSAIEAAKQIDAYSAWRLPPLSVDLAIDRDKRTWFCGATIGEGAEEKLSAAVGYALYLTQYGNRFTARHDRNVKAPAKVTTIGLLVGWALPRLFLEACRLRAESHGACFFYFYPGQVDSEKRQIAGWHWRGGKWRRAFFCYPDVIYDRMRRNNGEYEWLYKELSSIPITHRFGFGAFNKMKVYKHAGSDPELASAVIPFEPLVNQEQAMIFIDRYTNVILKPNRGSHGKKIVTINRVGGQYEVFDQEFVHRMSRQQLHELFDLFSMHNYFIQQFIDSRTKEGYAFHFRIHLMKDGRGEWKIVYIFPSFSLTPHMKITNHENTFRGVSKWEWFLQSQFGEKLDGAFDRKARAFSYRMTAFLEEKLGSGFHEVGLDLGVDEHGTIKMFEANLNNVGMNFHENETAKHGIEFALYLASN